MQPTIRSSGRKVNPIIQAARRDQIIEAAIDTVAAVGYPGTTLAGIAERAQTSKSVISYHFSGKGDLLEQVVLQIYADTWAFMEPRVEAQTTAVGQLGAYITAELDYMCEYRARLLAVADIVANHRTADGSLRFTPDAEGAQGAEGLGLGVLTGILTRGQRAGEFRDFDPQVLAVTVNHALDGALVQWVSEPSLDLDAYATELRTLFDLATRRRQRDPL